MKRIKTDKMEKEVEKLRRRIAELEKLEKRCRISEAKCVKSKMKYEKLENERAKFLKIVETTKDAIFVLSKDAQIVYTNPAMDELFGYEKGELIGKSPTVFNANPPDPKQFVESTLKAIQKTGYWEGEIQNRKKDGTEFTSYVKICAFKNGKGEITNFLSTEYDITENKNVKNQLKESLDKLKDVLEETIRAMALTIEKRDLFTAGHQRHVAELASAIATTMKLPEDRVRGVYMAGLLHDIGKINIPAALLMKPAQLTELEFKLVKDHPKVAYDILKGIEFPWPIAKFSLQHHERMDGSGYPNGLKNKNIALESRILAVADVVEAMSSARPYRPALGIKKALEEISSKKDLLYDADVVDACIKLFNEEGFKFR